MGLSQCVAEVPKEAKLNYEMLPLILAQFQQTHHLPQKSQNEHLKSMQRETLRKEKIRLSSKLKKVTPQLPRSERPTPAPTARVFHQRANSLED